MAEKRSGRGGSRAGVDALQQRILATLDCIPPGRVASYGQVAAEAGLPRRARVVGRVLGALPLGSELPWHRVVNARGAISSRGSGSSERRQRRLLEAEGVSFGPGGRVDMARHGWAPGSGS